MAHRRIGAAENGAVRHVVKLLRQRDRHGHVGRLRIRGNVRRPLYSRLQAEIRNALRLVHLVRGLVRKRRVQRAVHRSDLAKLCRDLGLLANHETAIAAGVACAACYRTILVVHRLAVQGR